MSDPFPRRMFDYRSAFDRNIGWVTDSEQEALRGQRIAIAGMGGVGGIHLLTLVRLGIGSFNLADFDEFDIANFNRQAGANVDTIGRPKLDVMAEAALSINPDLRINRFPAGVQPDNIDSFLEGVDLFVDGFDFFALSIRAKVFARCAELGIPAVTAAPIGMGTGYLAFVPGGMTFEQYFRLEGQPEEEQYLRFMLGVVPSGMHRSYLVDPGRINLKERRGPSTAAACQLCAGVVGTLALQLLLKRPGVVAAPFHQHFDAYRGRFLTTKLPKGNNTMIQRVRLALARRTIRAMQAKAAAAGDKPATPKLTGIERILDGARWAPSGDNTQPWRFEILDDETVRIHLTTEAGQNPYEYRDGEPSILSGGMLLETLRISASREGRTLEWTVEKDTCPYQILARLPATPGVVEDPLACVLSRRSVNRKPFLSRPLRKAERHRLEAAVDSELTVSWHDCRKDRLRIARLGMAATDIRLRARETFDVHNQVIDWTKGSSTTGLPASAVGLSKSTLVLMRWAMKHWHRADLMNRLTGTWAAALQLDLQTGLGSAAFFTMQPLTKADGHNRVETLLKQGAAVQRFWLTATRLGLAIQPALATLIFSHYGANNISFTKDAKLNKKARDLAARFEAATRQHPDQVAFMGRIGEPKSSIPQARSVRMSVAQLRSDVAVQDPLPAE